jgi:hypothetical protein
LQQVSGNRSLMTTDDFWTSNFLVLHLRPNPWGQWWEWVLVFSSWSRAIWIVYDGFQIVQLGTEMGLKWEWNRIIYGWSWHVVTNSLAISGRGCWSASKVMAAIHSSDGSKEKLSHVGFCLSPGCKFIDIFIITMYSNVFYDFIFMCLLSWSITLHTVQDISYTWTGASKDP